LWRQGVVRCPSSCSADAPAADCACGCPATGGDAEAVLEKAGASALAPPQGQWLEKLRTEGNFSADDALRLLCSVGTPGELFTSAAPQDPLFWPLHGLAERFLQYARVLKADGALGFDESWGYMHGPELPSDTGVVCDWSAVTPGSMEMPDCAKETCAGHKEDDTLPFEDLTTAQRAASKQLGRTKLYTNAEFYELVSPWSDAMPYAYDTLTYWPACSGGSLQSR